MTVTQAPMTSLGSRTLGVLVVLVVISGWSGPV